MCWKVDALGKRASSGHHFDNTSHKELKYSVSTSRNLSYFLNNTACARLHAGVIVCNTFAEELLKASIHKRRSLPKLSLPLDRDKELTDLVSVRGQLTAQGRS